MVEKIKHFMQKEDMVKDNSTVIVGVSGGADSVCLLWVLLQVQKEMKLNIVAVHINHNLRGEEANKDQDLVESLCAKWGVKLHVFSEDVEEVSSIQKISLEEAGRIVRREKLEAMAHTYSNAVIALGHHINDNVETSLMNQCRGTGVLGMAGILPVQGNYIRPLLCVKRQEIEVYLESHAINYCIDSSNLGNEYTRNRVRNLILPEIVESINVNAVENINHMLEDMRDMCAYLKLDVEKAIKKSVKSGELSYIIMHETYEGYHTIIKRELVKEVLVRHAGQSKDIARVHIESVCELFNLQVGREIHLPYEMIARRVQVGVEIRYARDWDREIEFQCIELCVPGKTLVDENLWIETSVVESVEMENIEETHYTKYFDCDIIKDKLLVDKVNLSDYITINAQGGRQSIKKYCTNQKIDYHLRKEMINIRDDSNVYWILGHRRSFMAKVTNKTNKILKIQIGGNEDGRKN